MTHSEHKTDAQLQHDVYEELKWDTRVRATDIGIEVSGGVVTLTGRVDNWAERIAAQEAAHRVSMVLDVANDIVVRPPESVERDDTDVAKAVRCALDWDSMVPKSRIRTTVASGIVTLEGDVDTDAQRDDAARCIAGLAGVLEVENRINVKPPEVTPTVLRSAIEHALQCHAGEAARHITIAVAGDEVSLLGNVQSWAERNAIEGAVRGTPGVRHVECKLRIEA